MTSEETNKYVSYVNSLAPKLEQVLLGNTKQYTLSSNTPGLININKEGIPCELPKPLLESLEIFLNTIVVMSDAPKETNTKEETK